ncbi:uncharacterized protein TRIREDRAFT_111717 [Trichoderma reesei QM6a]|jgi:hypothetical protein|uniref:Predicted protein n=2 Tax=Hypocrea jecorina TaxID=51453 RepID=G0RV91_HYPJQ|nr:uncharacterized protein TRIREDRAFT_111717 [Trichoderma reesei QM6a]EGR44947.1 predicted protein [Trichoderma reesei QM6a]ETR96713.1 hypothetical protein M419DRAFT_93496 [Trichoderma reesei RUT C-30]
MSTLPCLDFDVKTPACIEWRSNDATQWLVDPDPQRDHLMLESRFCNETSSASFQLLCPIRVKGIESQSHIICLIHTSSITSFDFEENPELPDPVRKKLNCKAIRLHLESCQPLDFIVPAAATEPVQPRKRLSGQAFDSLRSLAKASSLDIYISAREVSQIKLRAVCEAISRGVMKPFHTDIPALLASLYGSSGGKIVNLPPLRKNSSESPNDEPPSYADLEPPPPPDDCLLPQPKLKSPLADTTATAGGSNTKRRRLNDSGTSSDADCYRDILDTLCHMREGMQRLMERVEQLEKENQDLREELDDLRASCEKATDAIESDEAAFLEVHEELDELKVQVDFLSQGGLYSDAEEHLVEAVTDSVLTHMLDGGYNAKITIEKS